MSDDDLIRGPRWRTRVAPERRRVAVAVTAVGIVALGAVPMFASIWFLDRLDAPTWVTALPWWAPTIAAVGWSTVRPSPAIATDDDDDSWVGYVIRFVLAGDGELRPTPLRLVAAALLGAPIVWSMLVFGLLALAGLFEL